jgi:co-chaperonin GroES (HSP10)
MGIKRAVQGTIVPLRDKILVSDMNFGEETTKSGIILKGDDGQRTGIRPRWARVWAVGPEQKEVTEGEWILIEHGRWTRKFELEMDDGVKVALHGVDNKAILMSADEKPSDVVRMGE